MRQLRLRPQIDTTSMRSFTGAIEPSRSAFQGRNTPKCSLRSTPLLISLSQARVRTQQRRILLRRTPASSLWELERTTVQVSWTLISFSVLRFHQGKPRTWQLWRNESAWEQEWPHYILEVQESRGHGYFKTGTEVWWFKFAIRETAPGTRGVQFQKRVGNQFQQQI